MSAPIAISRIQRKGPGSLAGWSRKHPIRARVGGSGPSTRSRDLSVDCPAAETLLRSAIWRSCPAHLRSERSDLVQRALLKLVELSRGGPRSFSRTYLHRVAKSVLIDEIRRRRTRSEESFEGLASAELRSADARTPERLAHAGEIGGVIRASLDELARDRAAAVALHLQGFSVPETAQQLGWSRKRTENLVYRGLSDLRRKLRGRGVDPG